MSATVSEAGSMTPTERQLYAPETSKSIADVQRRQAAFEQQAAEQPLRTLVDPISRLERTMGSAARERIIKGLEQGGRPVRDERGMTVGVVTKTGLFGGEVYTGRPDYDPIAARVNRMTGTGDQGQTFQESGGIIQAVGQAAPAPTLTVPTRQQARAAAQPRKAGAVSSSRKPTIMGGPVQRGRGETGPILY